MPPVVRFPTKPPHPVARPFIAAGKLYERHAFSVALIVVAVAFLYLAVAQIADYFNWVMPL